MKPDLRVVIFQILMTPLMIVLYLAFFVLFQLAELVFWFILWYFDFFDWVYGLKYKCEWQIKLKEFLLVNWPK
jgi:hypothetical protein